MFKFLSAIVKRFFDNQSHCTYSTDLDQYILSNCPGSAAEVDFWVREYDKRYMKGIM